MAVWKKIIVSGSHAHLNSITASALTEDNFIVIGPNGELQNSGLLFDGSVVTLTGAKLIVPNDISGSGNLQISGSANVDSNLTVGGTATVTGAISTDSTLSANGAINTNGRLDVAGDAKITGSLTVEGGISVPTGSVVIEDDLTVNGDLQVNGDFTYLNTANLYVEDKFILLNSGSANPDEGGLIIDEGGAAGHAFVYDADAARFAFTGSLGADATSVTPDAFVPAIIDLNEAAHSDKAEYQKRGNIKVDSSDDIWIYV